MTVDAGRFTSLHSFPPGTSVLVANVGTSTAASVYTDKSTGTAAPNPVLADESGTVQFFAVPGDADLVYTVGDLDNRYTITVPADPTETWPG